MVSLDFARSLTKFLTKAVKETRGIWWKIMYCAIDLETGQVNKQSRND